MPVYEYKCKVCSEHFDVEQSFTDDSLTTLEGCEVDDSGQHQLKKVFHAVGISFKGEGFYRNDARSTSSSSTPPASKSTSDSKSSSDSNSTSSDSTSSSTGSDSSSSSGDSASKSTASSSSSD